MSRITQIPRQSGQPYTVRVQRQLADHTVIDASFVEPDDERAKARLALLLDAIDERMIAVNEKIMASTDRLNAAVDAAVKAKEIAQADGLNGGSDGPRSDRAAHLPADS